MYFIDIHQHDSKSKTTSTELDISTVSCLAWRNTTLTNIQWLVVLSWTWLWTKQSTVFSQGNLAYDGCKGIINAEDTVETLIWSHTVTLTLKISHGTLAHNDALPYYVWLQKVKSFRRYHPGKQSMTFWTFAVALTLTLNTAKHTFHKTLGDCGSW